MRKVELLPTRDCEAGYGPGWNEELSSVIEMTIGFSGRATADGLTRRQR